MRSRDQGALDAPILSQGHRSDKARIAYHNAGDPVLPRADALWTFRAGCRVSDAAAAMERSLVSLSNWPFPAR